MKFKQTGLKNIFQISLERKKSEEEKIQVIVQHWIRILHIKCGWIDEFDKFIVNYISTVFIFDTFRSSSKLINTFIGHINTVWSIDYSTFDNCQFICSGSHDRTVRVWDVDNNKQVQSFNGHSVDVYCVKFSQYHYHNNHQNVICSSADRVIRFWDFKLNQQLQIFDKHTNAVCGIEFSQFNGGRYLCSGSDDYTIRLWDVETSKSLHIFNGHEHAVCNNNSDNNNKMNNIG
ncbi:WD repeat-containing protein, partial [Reticulomyxa filosa]